MGDIAYVNGQYLPQSQGAVSIQDRGLTFADGVYEVIALLNGHLLDEDAHYHRLGNSLAGLGINFPMSIVALKHIVREVIRRNRVTEDAVYIQINRGLAKRDHVYPEGIEATLIVSLLHPKFPDTNDEKGKTAITHKDERWAHCEVKSISLLPNIIAKQKAAHAGAVEALLINNNGFLTEGAATNCAIVDDSGVVHTHPANERILAGITRQIIINEIAPSLNIEICERETIHIDELYAAKEVFLTSSIKRVLPLLKIDGKTIGSGKAGAVTHRLMEAYKQHITKQTGKIWK